MDQLRLRLAIIAVLAGLLVAGTIIRGFGQSCEIGSVDLREPATCTDTRAPWAVLTMIAAISLGVAALTILAITAPSTLTGRGSTIAIATAVVAVLLAASPVTALFGDGVRVVGPNDPCRSEVTFEPVTVTCVPPRTVATAASAGLVLLLLLIAAVRKDRASYVAAGLGVAFVLVPGEIANLVAGFRPDLWTWIALVPIMSGIGLGLVRSGRRWRQSLEK